MQTDSLIMDKENVNNDTLIKNPLKKSDNNNNATNAPVVAVNEMTSKDYYFDSYAHFGIHEVLIKSIFLFFLLI